MYTLSQSEKGKYLTQINTNNVYPVTAFLIECIWNWISIKLLLNENLKIYSHPDNKQEEYNVAPVLVEREIILRTNQ